MSESTAVKDLSRDLVWDGSSEDINIDGEFRDYVPAISKEEREQLEANLIEYGGARDPLTVWLERDNHFVLLDGHNRFEICKRLGLPFALHVVEFDTRQEAADWIDRNQLGRRNLSKQDYKLLLGRRYNRAKKQGERTDLTSGQNAQKSTTAEKLAREHGVDEKTVRRAGQFQTAAAKLGIEKEIAAGKVKASEAEVVKVAKALPANATAGDVEQARTALKDSAAARRNGKQADKPKAGDSRRQNKKAAGRITMALITVRRAVESLAETDSKYRDHSLAELQRYVGHLSRPKAAATAKPDKARPDDELRAAVVKRWGSMREWDTHWGIADMKDVRRLFIDVIRDEQREFDK